MKETLNFSQTICLFRRIIGVNTDYFLCYLPYLMETCVYCGVGTQRHASVGQHATLLKPVWMNHTTQCNFQKKKKQFQRINAVG
jgi:hypothetical protein